MDYSIKNYGCVQALGFTRVPTILLPRLPTIHEFILLGLTVIGRQEVLNVFLYLEGTFFHGFARAKIILGHLAQRMLQSIRRHTGENGPSARVPTGQDLLTAPAKPHCAAHTFSCITMVISQQLILGEVQGNVTKIRLCKSLSRHH